MKKLILAFSCFIVSMSFVAAQDNSKTFMKLFDLEGTWIMKSKNGSISGETWEKVNDQHLQSKGFYVKGRDTVITERVSIRKTDKEINFISTVAGQNKNLPVTFKLTSSDNNVFVFENSQHDFPKRIVYQFISANSIHAWIDAGKEGPAERQDFYFEKVK